MTSSPLGAIGKNGSIAVTEIVNKTLKRVPVIMGFDHLSRLCNDFSEWYNRWRPHMRLDGDAKTIPLNNDA